MNNHHAGTNGELKLGHFDLTKSRSETCVTSIEAFDFRTESEIVELAAKCNIGMSGEPRRLRKAPIDRTIRLTKIGPRSELL